MARLNNRVRPGPSYDMETRRSLKDARRDPEQHKLNANGLLERAKAANRTYWGLVLNPDMWRCGDQRVAG